MRYVWRIILFCLAQIVCGCTGLDAPEKNESSDDALLVLSEPGKSQANLASGSGGSVANIKRVGGEIYSKPALKHEELLACGISDSKLVDPQPMSKMVEHYQRMQMELEKNQASAAPSKGEQRSPPQGVDIQRLKERLNELKMYRATKRPNIVRVTGVSDFRDAHLNAYVKQVMSHISKSLDSVPSKSVWKDRSKLRFALQLDNEGRIYKLDILRKSGHDDLDFAVVQVLCEAQPYPIRVDETEIDLVEFVRTVTYELTNNQ